MKTSPFAIPTLLVLVATLCLAAATPVLAASPQFNFTLMNYAQQQSMRVERNDTLKTEAKKAERAAAMDFMKRQILPVR